MNSSIKALFKGDVSISFPTNFFDWFYGQISFFILSIFILTVKIYSGLGVLEKLA
jgi:hypothetical protein